MSMKYQHESMHKTSKDKKKKQTKELLILFNRI